VGVDRNGNKLHPPVSVVTPFYNTERYLSECIESVLGQSYKNFEYILVNNCSTDSSLEIAKKYAARDKRMRIINNSKFLGQVENYNHALRHISREGEYCKIVQADDWIFPNCLEQMVEVAEKHGSVGIVGSYRLFGRWVACEGLKYPSFCVRGRDACKVYLSEGKNIFGNATSMLYRSEIVRDRGMFYNRRSIVVDIEICFDVLQEWDYGFVHQILSYCRTQDDSITAGIMEYNPYLLHRVILLKKYGAVYLSPEEHSKLCAVIEDEYFMFLAKSMLIERDKTFWDYHKSGLLEAGIKLKRKMPKYLCKVFVDMAFNPKSTVAKFLRRRGGARGRVMNGLGEESASEKNEQLEKNCSLKA
jgi:glycosyltransferase involved in cell wall biosynthesis